MNKNLRQGQRGLAIGGLFVLLSYVSLNPTIAGGLAPYFGNIFSEIAFPIVAFILLTYGLIKLVKRNKLTKDERIDELEKRLDEKEKDER